MGYALVLSSNDAALRTAGPEAAALSLLEAAGDSSYPSGGVQARRVGPWDLIGRFHSSSVAALQVDTHGARILTPAQHAGPADAGWLPTISASAQNTAIRNAGRHPEVLARSADLTTALFGPDMTASSVRSLWWLYADSLGGPMPTGGAAHGFGHAILTVLGDRMSSGVNLGNMVSALNRAGGLTTDGNVLLAWSGNRLCPVVDLPEREAVNLAQRFPALGR